MMVNKQLVPGSQFDNPCKQCFKKCIHLSVVVLMVIQIGCAPEMPGWGTTLSDGNVRINISPVDGVFIVNNDVYFEIEKNQLFVVTKTMRVETHNELGVWRFSVEDGIEKIGSLNRSDIERIRLEILNAQIDSSQKIKMLLKMF